MVCPSLILFYSVRCRWTRISADPQSRHWHELFRSRRKPRGRFAPFANAPDALTMKQAAKLAGVTTSTVGDWCLRGQVESVVVQGVRYCATGSLMGWLWERGGKQKGIFNTRTGHPQQLSRIE